MKKGPRRVGFLLSTSPESRLLSVDGPNTLPYGGLKIVPFAGGVAQCERSPEGASSIAQRAARRVSARRPVLPVGRVVARGPVRGVLARRGVARVAHDSRKPGDPRVCEGVSEAVRNDHETVADPEPTVALPADRARPDPAIDGGGAVHVRGVASDDIRAKCGRQDLRVAPTHVAPYAAWSAACSRV